MTFDHMILGAVAISAAVFVAVAVQEYGIKMEQGPDNLVTSPKHQNRVSGLQRGVA